MPWFYLSPSTKAISKNKSLTNDKYNNNISIYLLNEFHQETLGKKMMVMLQWFANLVTYQWFNLAKGSHLADAVNFFVYDTLKIFFMLSVIIFVVAIIRSFFP
ncbi:MAG: hypothetical protein PHZ03_09380, partial [Syntrophomonas sp.]|nr:hypothetical protein [Syntrophomonas sp.]